MNSRNSQKHSSSFEQHRRLRGEYGYEHSYTRDGQDRPTQDSQHSQRQYGRPSSRDHYQRNTSRQHRDYARASSDHNRRSSSSSYRSSSRRPPASSRRSVPSTTSNTKRTRLLTLSIIGVVLILIVIVIAQCTRSEEPAGLTEPNQNDISSATSTEPVSPEPGSSEEELVPDRTTLLRILDTEDVDKLIALAETNEDALWIAAHPEEYAFEGSEVQYKILKLAANDKASLAYVREFPEKFPASDETADMSLAMSTKSPSSSVPDTNIPHLYQWDRRWAQTIYCSTSFGLTGCGPTALAMIYQGLTGDDSLDPYDLSLMAQEAGYMLQFDGTTDGFFTQTANQIGLDYEMPYPTVENITNALASGKPIIANLAPGYFTKYGHYVVLTGLDQNGNIIMNDPYSVVRSGQTWDPTLIANETAKIFVYSA